MDGRKSTKTFVSLSLFLLIFLSLSNLSSAQIIAPDGPGLDWEKPESHRLFLKGDSVNPYLDNNWSSLTGQPIGSVDFQKTAGPVNLIDIQSAPLENDLDFNGNITIHLFASLDVANDGCRFTNVLPDSPLGSETKFSVSLSLGSNQILSDIQTNSIVMEESFTLAHEFFVDANDINVSLQKGDLIGLKVDVLHDCVQTGVLWWDTYDAITGIEFKGDLIFPELDQTVDPNGIIRVEFTPNSPWGNDLYMSQVLEVIGPVEWEDLIHGNADEDNRLDHFETPHGYRIDEFNRTVFSWSSPNKLSPGKYMVDSCYKLSDQDPSESCSLVGVLRFEVLKTEPAFLNGSWAAILIPLGIIAWIGVSMKDAMLPLPAYGVILLLALTTLGPALNLPDIDFEEPRMQGAAPSFSLYEHGSESELVELSELMSNYDAIVVGLFTPSSPNAEVQRVDFEIAKKVIGNDVAFIQIATGDGVNSLDLEGLVDKINGSWPVLLDDSDSTVGKSFPSRASDAVFVIDSAGFISSWKPGVMSSQSIENAVDQSYLGSGQSPLKIFGLIISTTFLPIIILAMPRGEKYKIPESPLIPGAGFVLTLIAASIAFALWALPVALFSSFGLGSYWIFIELLLSLILVYHGVSMLFRGGVKEIEVIGKLVYSKLPDEYRTWRKENRFLDDFHLGLWVAWLLWLRAPSAIPQAIGAVARSGILGILICILFFIGYSLMAGLVVILSGVIVSIPGDISRIMGSLSVGLRPRAWGLACVILGMWISISIIVGPLMIIL
tara:strand:- start:93 stop:2423 length:2331 start_codon:yes stop_codon:yes gene_type:complete